MTTQEVLDELKKRGIQLKVSACGCCASPWITVVIDGVEQLNTEGVRLNNLTATDDVE